MKRITNLPHTVLRQVLSQAQTRPSTLTEQELAFANRIRLCVNCEHIWVQRGKKFPQRCPSCHSTQWALPSIRALEETHTAKQQAGKPEATA